ncbi:hypothetical protein QYM36_001350 [Artemia franciscana]|uniref:Uncharacterized protein n=1 Tax=Artemia franciscana TaxID=6661 RepID=A0AA88IAQ1_ARTSF|nr:hypothetical protein QYM36_001350 [Artemia franciscana]
MWLYRLIFIMQRSNLRMETSLNTFSQTGENIGIETASIDFRKEFTEADLKGLTELVKVFEALEKEEPVEQKRAPVDEIVKEKEILNDQRSSSENVVQDQYAPSNTLTSLIDERIKIKSTLWCKLFWSCLALGQNVEAYSALELNPDKSQTSDLLRSFLFDLLERGNAKELLNYSYSGMESCIFEYMLSRARSLPIAEAKDYYNFLYSLNITKNNPKQAGVLRILGEWAGKSVKQIGQLQYIKCFQSNSCGRVGPDCVWSDCRPAIEASPNAFLWFSNKAFVDLAAKCWKASSNNYKTICSILSVFSRSSPSELCLVLDLVWQGTKSVLGAPETLECFFVSLSSASAKGLTYGRVIGKNPELELETDEEFTVEVDELSDLKKEYDLTVAQLSLLQLMERQALNPNVPSSAQETVAQLVNMKGYELAISVARRFDIKTTIVIDALTSDYVNLLRSLNNDFTAESETLHFIRLNNPSVREIVSSRPVEQVERLLEASLVAAERSLETACHRTCAFRILSSDVFLPAWLVKSYSVTDCQRLYEGYPCAVKRKAGYPCFYFDSNRGHTHRAESFERNFGIHTKFQNFTTEPYHQVD